MALIIVTTRNHLSQHLAKAIQTNWNPPIGKNNMVKKHTHTKQNKHKTGGKLYLILKRESIRKLSSSNFQQTKSLYQSVLNNIAFFFTFCKGYRCNQLSVITPKKISYGSPRKKSNFKKWHLTHEIFKILPMFSELLWNLTFIFLCSQEKQSLVLLQITNYI